MNAIETINGTFKGHLVTKEKLPKGAMLIDFSYLKLDGRYNYDPFTEVYKYSTSKKIYLLIIKTLKP